MKRILSLLMAVTMILSVFSFQVVSAQEHSDENYSRTVTIEDGAEVYLELFETEAPAGTYPFLITETVTFTTPINCEVTGTTSKKWAGHMIITFDSMYENFDGANFVQQEIDGELMYVGIALEEENGFAFDGAASDVDYYRRQFTQAAGKSAFPGCLLTKKGTVDDISEMTNYSLILLDSDTFSFDSKNTIRTADFANSIADNTTYQDYNHTFTVYVKDGEEVSQKDYEGGGEPATHAFKVYGYDNAVLEDTTIAEEEAITMPTAPTVDGFEFKGWATEPNGAIVEPATHMGTEDLTYYAVYEEIPDAVTMDTPVYVTTNVLPGGAESVQIESFTVLASEILRVDTEFTYDSKLGTLEEMGMLFIPKAVIGDVDDTDVIAAFDNKDDDITVQDACCTDIPYLTGGGNVTFKAGLIGIPVKGIEIYAIPYYKLSDGVRNYQAMQTISF